MTTTPDMLLLFSESLLSKWGFSDGDVPYDYLDWCDATGTDYPAGGAWRAMLVKLVRERLVPALEQDVETYVMETNHNPIRARSVDGEDVTDLHYDPLPPDGPHLTPECIAVPFTEIAALLESL
jgi:hypothetical protein